MYEPYQPPERASPSRAVGSVRRARERMQAGAPRHSPPPIPPLPVPSRGAWSDPREAPSPPRQGRQQSHQPLSPPPSSKQSQNGSKPSRSAQAPQWPLSGKEGSSLPSSSAGTQYAPQSDRRIIPQRPPRPSEVPPLPEASRSQIPPSAYKNRPQPHPQLLQHQIQQRQINTPQSKAPVTQPLRLSKDAIIGKPPAIPVPAPTASTNARRSVIIGPPPSSRRGNSSYYSQLSIVSPIVEEGSTGQRSHGSYASSAAIPSSWGESPTFYLDGDDERRYSDVIEEGSEARDTPTQEREERGLVRQASLYRRGKPSVINTKSFDKSNNTNQAPAPLNINNRAARPTDIDVVGANGMREQPYNVEGLPQDERRLRWPIIGNMDSPLASGTGYIESSSSSTAESSPQMETRDGINAWPQPPQPGVQPHQARDSEILDGHEAASSIPRSGTSEPQQGYSRLSAIRRPPRLDTEAAGDSEYRGSLTSLPELIKRATKLAAMMERGKRPASRLTDLNYLSSDEDMSKDGEAGGDECKRRSGFSDMLAAFPPPASSPTRENSPRPLSSWPTPFVRSPTRLKQREDASPSPDKDPKLNPKPKRRCCGLPLLGFCMLILLGICIVVAAIVVPLELLVFHNGDSSSPAPVTPEDCQQSNPCLNGGTSVVSNDVCSCICTNGFTGSTCTVAGSTGCTTMTVVESSSNGGGGGGGAVTNVTVGQSIPRLLSQSLANFSIPLDAGVVLAQFNENNLTCTSENALVTFDGYAERQGEADASVSPAPTSAAATADSQLPGARRRRHTDAPRALFITSGGDGDVVSSTIVTDPASAPPLPSPSTSSSTSATAATSSAPTSTSTSPSSSSSFTVTEDVLDFARVSVLYVLQHEDLSTAITAQTSLQGFFTLVPGSSSSSSSGSAANLSIGFGNTVDLVGFFIDVGNGTVGGGSGSGNGSSGAVVAATATTTASMTAAVEAAVATSTVVFDGDGDDDDDEGHARRGRSGMRRRRRWGEGWGWSRAGHTSRRSRLLT